MKFDLSNLRIPKITGVWSVPKRKTASDRSNPFFPNVVRGGSGIIGLAENTFQCNRGGLWEEYTIKIEDALALLRMAMSTQSVAEPV